MTVSDTDRFVPFTVVTGGRDGAAPAAVRRPLATAGSMIEAAAYDLAAELDSAEVGWLIDVAARLERLSRRSEEFLAPECRSG